MNETAKAQIDVIKQRCEDMRPLVAIECTAYNHKPYIRDALEGFVKQKTDFPFVAIVHDDASTDKTAEIIKEYAEKYPDIILPIYEKENQYSKRDGSLGKILRNAKKVTGAKYIAFCEGDDYWTDPLKLQKQVNFLESHPDYGMCYTQVERIQETKFIDIWGGKNETLYSLLKKNTIPTLTVVLRVEHYQRYIKEIKPQRFLWQMGDIPLWLYICGVSKIKYLSENPTGVYRIVQNSASHSAKAINRLEFGLNGYNIHLFFYNYFKLSKPTIKYYLYIRKYMDFIKYFVRRPNFINQAWKVFSKHRYKNMMVHN